MGNAASRGREADGAEEDGGIAPTTGSSPPADDTEAEVVVALSPSSSSVSLSLGQDARGLKLGLLAAAREVDEVGAVDDDMSSRLDRLTRGATSLQRRVLATRLLLSLGREATPTWCLQWRPWQLENSVLERWRLGEYAASEVLSVHLARQRLPEWIGVLDVDGGLDLQYTGLTEVPPSIGELHVQGHLRLAHNSLSRLPEEFCDTTVGGGLKLSHNRLTRLPGGFGGMQVGGGIRLEHNALESLPASIGRLRLGGGLHLSHNRLASLPPEMGELEVPGTLALQRNQLSELPPEFGAVVVGGDLRLDRNQLTSLPPECRDLRVGGYVWLGANRLAAAPSADFLPRVVMGESRRSTLCQWRCTLLLSDAMMGANAAVVLLFAFAHDQEMAPPYSGFRFGMLASERPPASAYLLFSAVVASLVNALSLLLQRHYRMRPSNWRRYLAWPLLTVHLLLAGDVGLFDVAFPDTASVGIYYGVLVVTAMVQNFLVALAYLVSFHVPLSDH